VISPPTYDTILITSCNEYIAPSGTIFNNSGWYTDTIINQQGCDSILNIDLTILNESNSIIDTSVCSNFLSPSGNYTWPASGTYFDTLVNAIGCDSVIQVNLTIAGPSDSIINNNNTLTAYTGSATYQWLDCDNNFSQIVGEINQSYQPSLNGNYAVEISINNCIDTSNCVSVTLSAINGESADSQILVYPNPTKDWITISTIDHSPLKAELYDQLGAQLTSTTRTILSLKPYKKGVYFLKIIHQNKISVVRIIKQ